MKKYAIAAALLVALSASAQKDELKALKKLDQLETAPTQAQIKEYKDLFAAFESKIGNASAEQKNDFYYYRGTYYLFVETLMNPANAMATIDKGMEDVNKVLEYEKTGKKKYTQELTEQSLPELKAQLMTIAGALLKQQKFKEAANAYALAYKIDPRDQANLYNAAASATNAQDYDKALEYYLELDKIGFTGEGMVYSARNVKTGEVEYFPNLETMNIAVNQKLYSNPKTEKSPSLRGEIVKNIALLYNQKGDIEKAKAAMADARKANPNDTGLLLAEADLYLKTNNTEMYKKLVTEAAQKNPNNPDLFYNLGVIASKTDKAEAMKQYEKALAINPNYVNANINVGALILGEEEKIVNEMNSLGTSAKDNKRYDELKAKRDGLFKKALPYFEKAHKAEPDNEYVISMIANIYQAMDKVDEAKAMRAKIKS